MSDTEWERWQKTFQRKEGVMPQIEKSVRRTKRGLLVSHLIFAAIGVGELAFGTWLVLDGSDRSGRVAGAFLIAIMTAMAALYGAIVAGLWKREQATPDALLTWVERSLQARERIGLLCRWMGLVACAVTAAFFVNAHLHGDGLVQLLPGMVFTAAVLAATWTTPMWVRRRNQAKRAQVDAWRKQLSEF